MSEPPPTRVLLVRHAPTAATRDHAFPADEPLDGDGERAAAALAGRLPVDRTVCSPARRCRSTADAASFPAVTVDPRWAELDFGRWAGRAFDTVWAEDRAGLAAWLDDPHVAPPGGEGLSTLHRRVAAALDDLVAPGTTTAVVTSAGPIKVAVLSVLGAPLDRLRRLDVRPCSVTTLEERGGGWTVLGVGERVAVRVPA